MQKNFIQNHIPTYVAVYNSLYSDIMNDVYTHNTFLPNEIVLAKHYNVSRNTLRQALSILSEDGLIIKSQGKGTLVQKIDKPKGYEKLSNPMLTLATVDIDDITMQYNFNPPTDIARKKLGLGMSEIILASDIVYKSNNIAIGYSFIQIPIEVCKKLNIDISNEESISNLLHHQMFDSASKGDISIKIILSTVHESNFLDCEENIPLILIEALYIDNKGSYLGRCKFYFLPEYYNLHFQI